MRPAANDAVTSCPAMSAASSGRACAPESIKRHGVAPFEKQLPVTGLHQAKHKAEHGGKH